jgi:Uma2 family endonuclease
MIQALQHPLSFEAFLEQYPEDGGRYELVDGEVVEISPIGRHEDISGFISLQLGMEIYRLGLPYSIPKTCLVKSPRPSTGHIPDVIVLDKQAIADDPLWQKSSTITLGQSARLVVEVVSTNWRDDYLKKLDDYETLGIPDYWIVDYLAIGAVRYIGEPKQPTLSVYQLVDGEYRLQQFRGAEQIISSIFPELKLTAEQVFQG